jgi:hypothetical protein
MSDFTEEIHIHIMLWRRMAYEGQLEAIGISDPYAKGHLLGICDSLKLLADTLEKTLEKYTCQKD